MDTDTQTQDSSAEEQELKQEYRLTERFLLVASIIINIGTWLAVIIWMPYTSDSVILHYNTYFGVDLFGGWWQLLIAPFLGTVVIGIHSYGFRPFDRSHAVMRVVSYAIMTFIQVMLLVGMLLLIPYNS